MPSAAKARWFLPFLVCLKRRFEGMNLTGR